MKIMDKKEALLCAKVCRLSYVSKYDFNDFKLTARFDNKATDTQGLFGVAYDNTLVVAFRGTEETKLADWLTDLKFSQEIFPYGDASHTIKVHSGFLKAYKSVRDAVLEEARKTKYKRIICTGHSLGGAVANLYAVDISFRVLTVDILCYTYGSPKPGNEDFGKLYDKRIPNTFRIVNGSDGVPKLPPHGYIHVGKFCEIGDKGRLAETVTDHLPNSYIEVIQAL
jgi:predicted lipase